MKQTVIFLVLSTLAVALAAPLSERDQQLAQLTGSTTLAEIKQVFKDIFQSPDIDQVLQQVSQVTNQKDPVSFMAWCVEITQKPNIQEASKDFRLTTPQEMTFIELLEQTAAACGHDLKDFYVQLVKQTASPNLIEMFKILQAGTGYQDIFDMLQIGVGITAATDLIVVHEIELNATHTNTLQECFGLICESTGTQIIVDAYQVLKAITNADIAELFKVIATFKVNSWAEFVGVITEYTGTSDFISAMKAVPKATGKSTNLDGLKHIQQAQ